MIINLGKYRHSYRRSGILFFGNHFGPNNLNKDKNYQVKNCYLVKTSNFFNISLKPDKTISANLKQ